MLTKESIIQMLKTDKRAVARALVVLHNRQTNDEQAQEGTRHLNGRGFRPCHARMGSSMAKFFLRYKTLSDKQVEYWRKLDRKGNMRIGIYAGQLLEEAELKAKNKDPVTKSEIIEMVAAVKGIPVVYIPDYATEPNVEAVTMVNQVLAGKIAADTAKYGERDYGNDMERRMVLEEMYGDVLDSDDPALYGPLKDEMDELDAYWAKIRGNK